ncbi:MAG: hypothetical protein M9965_12880 [Anaerolineae bacterium]|nr:hypothetical protein [Anaerolineae bacterium]
MQFKKLTKRLPAILLAILLLTVAMAVLADGYTDAELAELAADADHIDTLIAPIPQEPIDCTVGQPTDFYFSDFEANDGGWAVTTAYDEWEWGTIVPGVQDGCDTTRPNEPAGAHSGVNVWATDLDGCYDNQPATDSTVLSQSFDLSGLTAPIELSWWNWYEVFVSFDKGEVYVDGNLVWEVTTTAATDWTQEVVDLSAYAGDSDVTIDFSLTSTTVVNRMGWYLDDVAITYCEEPPTAVELTAFSADVNPDGSVTVNWETSAEVNSAGFNVYRSTSANWDATATLLTPALIASQSANGSGASYSFADAPGAGVWHYYLEEVDLSGATHVYGPATAVTQAPTSAALTGLTGNANNLTLPLVLASLLIATLVIGITAYRREDA